MRCHRRRKIRYITQPKARSGISIVPVGADTEIGNLQSQSTSPVSGSGIVMG
jgi:hypothetical protein